MKTEVFMMGEFEAQFPDDRDYARNHMWAQVDDSAEDDSAEDSTESAIYRFGFSAYAVRLLQDVYFLDWEMDPPVALLQKQDMGSIESKKAESTIYAPCDGTLTEWNSALMSDPTSINVDKYGDGWLFSMQVPQPDFLTASQYIDYLESVWQDAQRTIKGQMNQ